MDYTRQRDLVNQDLLNQPLCVVGAGAIGSFTVLNLAKMGYTGSISVYDDDVVTEHNIPNQFYDMKHATNGEYKVFALSDIVLRFADILVTPFNRRLTEVPQEARALLLTVDHMDDRILLYNSAKANNVRWVFDGRMGGEVMRIYTVDMNDDQSRALYEGTLYPTNEATQERCTARAVIYNVSVIAGLLTNQIKRAMSGQSYMAEIIFSLSTLTLLTQGLEHAEV